MDENGCISKILASFQPKGGFPLPWLEKEWRRVKKDEASVWELAGLQDLHWSESVIDITYI